MDKTTAPDSETVLSVSDLNREARYLLEDNFPAVLVEGEISNIATPASGHWYLTLKDQQAQVRCAMFRNRNMRVRFRPADGMQVLVKGKVSLYEGRGDFQLILEQMEQRGDGALLRAYEQLKDKLFREGLFDDNRKRPLPDLPRHIGVITSPTGAAVRDIISTLRRRFPAIAVTVLPVTVQGNSAASEMIAALKTANTRQGCLADLDVVIIGRGGGSLEDLWSFNDEALARAIYASDLPVVSAVGHEVDFTIADFVADARAATPTAAAELLSPDQAEYRLLYAAYLRKLAGLMTDCIRQHRQRLAWLAKQLKHPGRKLEEQAQRLDELEARLKRGFRHRVHVLRSALAAAHLALRSYSPMRLLREYRQAGINLEKRLARAVHQVLAQRRQQLAATSHNLHAVSPLNTLSRGYSITTAANGQVIADYHTVKAGDTIRSRLEVGEIISIVEQSLPPGTGNPPDKPTPGKKSG